MAKLIHPLRDQIPFSRAILLIFLYTLMVSGLAWMGWLYYVNLKKIRLEDDQYRLIAIVQSCSQKESLKTDYIAELLHLSVDKPVNLHQYNKQEGMKYLLSCPLIKNALIKRILPGTLYVDYSIRIPELFLADYINTSIDSEGYLLPFKPFFTPKKLPSLFLGLENLERRWGDSLYSYDRFQLSLKILRHLQNLTKGENLLIKQIDVSRAFSESYGKKQIIVTLEDRFDYSQSKTIYLRLNPENYKHNLANFMVLRSHLRNKFWSKSLEKPTVIDLRIDHLAFVNK